MILRRAALVLALILLASPASARLGLFAGGGATGGGSYTGACDTITGGCAAAFSTAQSFVAAYAGPMFELVQQDPVWTGTGYISGTTFTVSSTATGALPSSNVALSAPGSGTTPALAPITHIISGSGPYTVDKSQTAGSSGSPLTMAAYRTYDVPQASHVADLSGVPAFCKGHTCLYLIDFNEPSTGSANDLIASNISGGNTFNPNCTASIVTCAPLYWIDPNLNVPMIPASYPTGMETCAGAVPCAISGVPSGNVSQDVMMAARPDIYTTCCGEFGKMEQVGATTSGSMFALVANLLGAVFGCTTPGEWCIGSDLEGAANLVNVDGGTSQQSIYELKYNGSSTLSVYYNNASVFSGAPATTPINPTGSKYIRLGLAGDRSTAPVYFYGGLITTDSGSHTAAYNNLASWYATQSPVANPGPLDVAFYVNPGAVGASNGYQSAYIGNGQVGYSGRCLTASYTGPVVDLTDSEGSPVTNSYACVSGALDPAASTFCAANPPCRISAAYVQAAWSPQGGNVSNVYDPLLKLTCSGGLSTCPTATFNSLNGQMTWHFPGTACLISGTLSGGGGYIAHVLNPWEIGAVMRRTSGTAYAAGIEWGANSYYFLGAGNAANTAAFSNGQAFGSGTASDNHWHSLIADTTVGSGGTLYVDGVSAGTAGNNAGEVLQSYVTVGCGWNGSAIINPLTGDIAEVWMQHRTLDASGTLTSRVAALFANDQAFWGALPN